MGSLPTHRCEAANVSDGQADIVCRARDLAVRSETRPARFFGSLVKKGITWISKNSNRDEKAKNSSDDYESNGWLRLAPTQLRAFADPRHAKEPVSDSSIQEGDRQILNNLRVQVQELRPIVSIKAQFL